MAIIVEDGTGLAASNSYVSLEAALAYHADHGYPAWAASSDPLRSAALIRATAALDGKYSGRWPGVRCMELQALDWPRYEAWDRDGYPLVGVPSGVKNATCAAALIELATPGALSAALDRGGMIAREKTGPIETEFFAGAPASTVYQVIKQALARIVKGGGSVVMSRG